MTKVHIVHWNSALSLESLIIRDSSDIIYYRVNTGGSSESPFDFNTAFTTSDSQKQTLQWLVASGFPIQCNSIEQRLNSLAMFFSPSKRLGLKWPVISTRSGQPGDRRLTCLVWNPPTEISVFCSRFLLSVFRISQMLGREDFSLARGGGGVFTCLICLCPLPLLAA